jgi:hypothetical protein
MVEMPTGWQPDPFAIHEFRFFSDDGKPTRLVLDGGVRSYDPPPPRVRITPEVFPPSRAALLNETPPALKPYKAFELPRCEESDVGDVGRSSGFMSIWRRSRARKNPKKNLMWKRSKWIRVTSAVVVGSVVVLFSARALAVSQNPQTTVTAASPLGVYGGTASPGIISALGQLLGQKPAYAMDFLDGTSWQSIEDPSWFLSQWQGSGYQMIWGVPILPNSFSPDSNVSDTSGSASGLQQGAQGDFDQYFVTLAQALVAGGQGDSIIRLGWEFNGGWFPWAANGSAANFIAYWQNIVTAMRSVSGQDFKFEWNPTLGDLGVGNLADYYPGSNYVDYIGADVYDQEWATYPGAAAEFSNMETETYGLNWLATFAAAQGKPITLPEWGLGSGPGNGGAPISDPDEEVAGGDDPTFINDMAAWIKTNNVYEATFYDVGQSAVGLTTNPNSFAALVNDFGPATTTVVSPTTTTTNAPSTTTTTSAPASTTTTTSTSTSTSTTTQPPPTTTTPPPPASTTTTSTPSTTTVPSTTTTTTAPSTTTTSQPPPESSTTTTDPTTSTTTPSVSSSSTTTTSTTSVPSTTTPGFESNSVRGAICRAVNYYLYHQDPTMSAEAFSLRTPRRVQLMLRHAGGSMRVEAAPLLLALQSHNSVGVEVVFWQLQMSSCSATTAPPSG